MLSEAVKPFQERGCDSSSNISVLYNFDNSNNNSNNNSRSNSSSKRSGEDYDQMCRSAAAQGDKTGVAHLKGRRFSRQPGNGVIQMATATPFALSRDVNEAERTFRLMGACRDARVSNLAALRGSPVAAGVEMKRNLRKEFAEALRRSKAFISFMDLSLDVTKVPLGTSRGNYRVNKGLSMQTSREYVDFSNNPVNRLGPADFGGARTVEDRVGYPQMKTRAAAGGGSTRGSTRGSTPVPTRRAARGGPSRGLGGRVVSFANNNSNNNSLNVSPGSPGSLGARSARGARKSAKKSPFDLMKLLDRIRRA